MILAAAVAAAVFTYLAVGYLSGYAPARLSARLRPRRARVRIDRQVWLDQAGARVTPVQFWATSFGAGAFAFVVVYGIAGTAVVAAGPAVGVGALPRAFYARRRAAAGKAHVAAWPDALRSLAANLSSSLSLHQALVALSHTGPPALRATFGRYARLAGTLDQRAALQAVREELADPVSDRIIEVLILAGEQGPSITLEVLADLATATAADLALADRIETAQLEQKLNARAVFVLPYLILILLCATGEEFRRFYSSAGGLVVVGVGVAMSSGGMAIIARLGRLPGEPRVLGTAAEANP